MSVEELVTLIQNLNPKQRIPDAAFHALFHFDSRAAALLLKDLSKAGSSARATELFEWLRSLETGHPLQVSQTFSASEPCKGQAEKNRQLPSWHCSCTCCLAEQPGIAWSHARLHEANVKGMRTAESYPEL